MDTVGESYPNHVFKFQAKYRKNRVENARISSSTGHYVLDFVEKIKAPETYSVLTKTFCRDRVDINYVYSKFELITKF